MVMTRGIKRRIKEEEEAEAAALIHENNMLKITFPGFSPSNLPHQHISRSRVPKRIKICERVADIVLKVAGPGSQNPVNIPFKSNHCSLKSEGRAMSSCLSRDLEPLQVPPLLKRCSLTTSGRYPNHRARQVFCRRNRSTAAIGSIKKEKHAEHVPDGTQMDTSLTESLHHNDSQALTIQQTEDVNDKNISNEHTSLQEVTVPIIKESFNSPNDADSVARPATSLNLSAVAELDDDGSSMDSELLHAAVTIGGYRVKEDLASILRDILSKYGDIAAQCDKKSIMLRSWLVENVCDIVQKLQTEKFVHLTPVEVDSFRVLVQDIKSDGMEVGWLYQRLNEIYEAKRLLKQSPHIKQAKSQTRQATKDKEEEIRVYKEKIKVYEEEICKLQEKIISAKEEMEAKKAEESRLDEILSYTKVQVKRFHCGSMTDGLL